VKKLTVFRIITFTNSCPISLFGRQHWKSEMHLKVYQWVPRLIGATTLLCKIESFLYYYCTSHHIRQQAHQDPQRCPGKHSCGPPNIFMELLWGEHFWIFTCESSYCFQRILAIAILSVRPSICHTGGSVKNGASSSFRNCKAFP